MMPARSLSGVGPAGVMTFPPPDTPGHGGVVNFPPHPVTHTMAPKRTDPSPPTTIMPKPPSRYYTLYTKENIESRRVPSPPPIPSDSYKMFGFQFQVNDPVVRSLESQNIRRLYAQNSDHRKELKKFNHSIVVNFLDLIDILVKSPDRKEREDKITDLNQLFIQMHHLINEFRPSEARETLRVILEFQKSNRIETVERFQRHLDKVKELLQGCLETIAESKTEIDAVSNTNPVDHNLERERHLKESNGCNGEDILLCEQADLYCQQIPENEQLQSHNVK